MRREEDISTKCKKCNRFIRTQNFLIHQSRCNGPSRIFSSQQSRLRQNRQQQIEQKIPCSFCSYPQTLKELDTHPLQCQHRQTECQRCHGTYPLSLISQHQSVCPARRQRQSFNPFTQNFEQRSRQRMPHNIFDIFNNMQQRRNVRNSSRRREQEIPPNLAEQRIINPFFQIMVRGNHGRQRDRGLHEFIRLVQGLASHHGRGRNKNLSKNQINSLPVTKYKLKEEPELCTICYCQFEDGQNVMSLPCTHLYHPDCVTKWLQKNSLCPVCKHDCKKNEVKNKNQRNDRQRRSSRQNIF